MSPLRVCLQAVYFDWSLMTARDTPTRRRWPLMALKKDRKKKVESATRSGGEVGATTIKKDPSLVGPSGPRERPRRPLVFIDASYQRTNMAQGDFKVGPVARPKPTRVQQGQKYLRPRWHSPFWGASGARQLTPPEGGKSLGDGPLRPEEISSAEAHPAEPPRGKTAYRM